MDIKKALNGAKYYLVDTTALLASTHPIYSGFETTIAGMTDEVSIDSRIFITKLSYLGTGIGFSKLRDFSRKVCKITEKTSEKVQAIHDTVYSGVFNAILAPIVYLHCGASPREALIGGLTAIAFGATMGAWMGYSVDVARDLVGIGECKRKTYPKFLKKQNKWIKRAIATGLVATSVGLMGAIYSLTPDKETPDQSRNQESRLEQAILQGDN